MIMISSLCKCGSGKIYLNCCGIFITNVQLPQTPEQLMRSRYTAYACCNIDYIAKTMCGRALNGFHAKDVALWAKDIRWIKLEILNTKLEHNNKGFVEFKAYYTEHDIKQVLHEISEFQRKSGKWFYVDGVILH